MQTAGINGHATGPTIPASADTLLRFQVGKKADEPERDDAPVWLLAAPTEKLQRAYRAGLQARGLRYPQNDEIIQGIVLGLDKLHRDQAITDEDFAEHRRVIEQYEELPEWNAEKDGPTMPWERRVVLAGFNRLFHWATEHVPYVQELQQKRVQFSETYPKIAFKVALRGAERAPHAVVVQGTEADDATVAPIDDETQTAGGAFWLAHSMLTAVQKKTSATPPPSPTTPKTTGRNSGKRRSATAGDRSPTTMNGTSPLPSIPVT